MPYKDPAKQAEWRARHREQTAVYNRTYREENREVLAAYDRRRYADDREAMRARRTAYYLRNAVAIAIARRERYPEKRQEIAARTRAYAQAHPEQMRAWRAAWKRAHPESVAAYNRRRKASVRGAAVCDLTAAEWGEIKAAWDRRCAYCGERTEVLTQDHVIPVSRGGDHTASNIVPACQPCNSKKGAKLL